MMVGGVSMALREDVGLSWLIVVCVPLLLVVAFSIVRGLVPAFRLMQTRIDVVNRTPLEQITGIRVVREPYETERFRSRPAAGWRRRCPA